MANLPRPNYALSYGVKTKVVKPKPKPKKVITFEDMTERQQKNRKFYNSYRWKQLRNYYLFNHPTCEQCAASGITTVATVVDHIIPWQREPDNELLKWNEDNLQALCASCHAKKTYKEMYDDHRLAQQKQNNK